MHICFRPSFDDVTPINFRFRILVTWPSPHGRGASSHKLCCRYMYPVQSYWHFLWNSRWRPPPSWILSFLWIWPFWRVDSMVFVLSAKFGSNICYSHCDRHTYASNLHLMTSRQLTSGFDFWSRGHLRVAVMHLPIQFDAIYLYQSKVIDIFRNSRWRQ